MTFPRPRRISLAAAAAAIALVFAAPWSAPPASAQGAAYCNVTAITTRRLPNAVQITIRTDGSMRLVWDFAQFFDIDALQKGRWDNAGKPLTVLPFSIANARSRVVPLTDVGVYPASHVEVSAPPDAPEGIGVNVKVVLFTPAVVTSVHIPEGPDIPAENVKIPTVSVQLTPDQTSLIVLIKSDRRTEAPLVLRKAPPGAPVELNVSIADSRVSVDALNASLREVVREIAAKGHREIVLNGGLEHTVSMHLEDLSPDEAIDAIAMAYGLAADTSGPVIRMAEGSAASLPAYEQSNTVTIPCLNASAVAVRDSLPEFLLKFLRVDSTQNSLTLTGPAYLTGKVRADVATLDRPVPVVEVTARVLEFESSDDLDAALSLGVRRGEGYLNADGSTGDITFRSQGPLPDVFESRLHALIASGRVRTVAEPRASALLGQPARLFVGQRKYITIRYMDMLAGEWQTDALGVDVGTRISVTPLMVGDAGLTVSLESEVNSIAEVEARTGLPTVNTRNASATLRVMEGDTIIVGGLATDQTSRSARRIPGLGDIPLIGGLFRARSRSRARGDLVFMLTARVVRPPATAG